MRPWNPAVELSPEDLRILKLCKQQKIWRFLRENRHLLLDEQVRLALHGLNLDCGLGRPPVAPEQLFLAMLLQVAFRKADHEVPALTALDRRWQMVLGVLGEHEPLFSQGTVFNFRERVREAGLMQLLLDKTVALARDTGGFGHKNLRAMFDSSPLTGAGRVEDTFNLMGRAIRELAAAGAVEAGVDLDDLALDLSLSVVIAPSVKAALDVDWRLEEARREALQMLLSQAERLLAWLRATFPADAIDGPPLGARIQTLEKVIEQDTEPDPEPPPAVEAGPVIKESRAGDRRISYFDPDMRHGRKSSSRGFAGYKRHIAVDADLPGLILATAALPGNRPEAEGATPLFSALDRQHFELVQLHIDRGYIANDEVNTRRLHGLEVISKPPSVVGGRTFGKHQFAVDFGARKATCPANKEAPFSQHRDPNPRQQVRWSPRDCRPCHLRAECIGEKSVRPFKLIQLHPHEAWFREMADDLGTPQGRAKRRLRIGVEHTLARIGAISGPRARFRGLPKVGFDLARTAVVNNLFVLANSLESKRKAA